MGPAAAELNQECHLQVICNAPVASMSNLHNIGDMSPVLVLRTLVAVFAALCTPKSKTTIAKVGPHSEIGDFDATRDFLLGFP